MKLAFHVPPGKAVEIDSDTVTDAKLSELGMSREWLKEFVARQTPRDLPAEFDQLKAELKAKGIINEVV